RHLGDVGLFALGNLDVLGLHVALFGFLCFDLLVTRWIWRFLAARHLSLPEKVLSRIGLDTDSRVRVAPAGICTQRPPPCWRRSIAELPVRVSIHAAATRFFSHKF